MTDRILHDTASARDTDTRQDTRSASVARLDEMVTSETGVLFPKEGSEAAPQMRVSTGLCSQRCNLAKRPGSLIQRPRGLAGYTKPAGTPWAHNFDIDHTTQEATHRVIPSRGAVSRATGPSLSSCRQCTRGSLRREDPFCLQPAFLQVSGLSEVTRTQRSKKNVCCHARMCFPHDVKNSALNQFRVFPRAGFGDADQ